jgi:Phosphotransferase enzyme family
MEVASGLDLAAADARVLHNSNKLALRLLPCDVVARVAFAGLEAFQAELEIARRLTEIEVPVASLEPRVEPRVYERHGFVVTFWTYSSTLRSQRREISERTSGEQLLHGEPHAGNLLNTKSGPLFIDLETCCRGPVEFDLAHVPEEVSECYSGADQELLRACRLLVLAMVAAWRWDLDDQLPNGKRAGQELLGALRAGPPWPALDVVMHPARVP